MTSDLSHSDPELRSVMAQIGRPPRGEWRVARVCRCGLPQVIETYPRLDDGTPFPTTFWLTCRALTQAVSRLEATGSLDEINKRIHSDAEFRTELEKAQQRYIEYRDELERLGDDTHPGGGPLHVKCLHAHVAHHLALGPNPIGEEIIRSTEWIEPETPCVLGFLP